MRSRGTRALDRLRPGSASRCVADARTHVRRARNGAAEERRRNAGFCKEVKILEPHPAGVYGERFDLAELREGEGRCRVAWCDAPARVARVIGGNRRSWRTRSGERIVGGHEAMTGKRTPPDVTRSLAITADSRLQPRIGARSSWISHPARRCTAESTRTTARRFQHGTTGVRRRAAMPNRDVPAANYDIVNDSRQDYRH